MPPRFVPAAALAEIPEGRGRRVLVERIPVALFRVEGSVVAVADTCPHRGASLGEEGHIDEDGHLVCGWHGWTFDPGTGERILTGQRCLLTFPVRLEDDRVLVGLPA